MKQAYSMVLSEHTRKFLSNKSHSMLSLKVRVATACRTSCTVSCWEPSSPACLCRAGYLLPFHCLSHFLLPPHPREQAGCTGLLTPSHWMLCASGERAHTQPGTVGQART